jgi:hypothetical protein
MLICCNYDGSIVNLVEQFKMPEDGSRKSEVTWNTSFIIVSEVSLANNISSTYFQFAGKNLKSAISSVF